MKLPEKLNDLLGRVDAICHNICCSNILVVVSFVLYVCGVALISRLVSTRHNLWTNIIIVPYGRASSIKSKNSGCGRRPLWMLSELAKIFMPNLARKFEDCFSCLSGIDDGSSFAVTEIMIHQHVIYQGLAGFHGITEFLFFDKHKVSSCKAHCVLPYAKEP
jgi:hypothetical protein